MVLQRIYFDDGFGHDFDILHVPEFKDGCLDFGTTQSDNFRHFAHAAVVGIDLVEIDFLAGGIDVIADIVQCNGQVMDVLPIKGGDKILAQFLKNLVRVLVIPVFQLLKLGNQGGPLVVIRLVHHLAQQIAHFDHRDGDLLKQGIKNFVFGQKDSKKVV